MQIAQRDKYLFCFNKKTSTFRKSEALMNNDRVQSHGFLPMYLIWSRIDELDIDMPCGWGPLIALNTLT